jgi:hypothetical protein
MKGAQYISHRGVCELGGGEVNPIHHANLQSYMPSYLGGAIEPLFAFEIMNGLDAFKSTICP